ERASVVDPLQERRSNVRARLPHSPRLLMRYRSICVALLSLILVATPYATASAGTPQDDACFDKLVTSVKLEVDGHPEYPQSLVSGLDLRKDTPFTRE